MKPNLILSALLSCFVISGNAQESVPITSYGTQGNAAQNRSVYELELQRAAQEARRMKELKAAMASSGFAPPPPITTASQFLAANRPPMPPPSEASDAPEGERPAAYVPEFESRPTTPSRPVSAPSRPVSTPSRPVSGGGGEPSFALPEKERSFFKWMKGKKAEDEGADLPPVGAAEYQNTNPFEAPETGSAPPEPPAPEPMSEGIPDVPAMNEEPAPIMRDSAPPAPAMEEPAEPAPIFVRREEPVAAAAETAVVEKDADAVVSGVLVKLFAGTEVAVLSRSGSEATVRLPDGRVGTVKRKSLSR